MSELLSSFGNSAYSRYVQDGWLEAVIINIHELNDACKAIRGQGDEGQVIMVLSPDTKLAAKIACNLRVTRHKLYSMCTEMARVIGEAVLIARNILADAIPLIDSDFNSNRTVESIVSDLNKRETLPVQNPDLYYEIDFKPPFDIKVKPGQTSSYSYRRICMDKLPEIERICKEIFQLMQDYLTKIDEKLSEDLIRLCTDVAEGRELPENLIAFLPSEDWLMGIDDDVKTFSNLINAIYHNLVLCDIVVTDAVRAIKEAM